MAIEFPCSECATVLKAGDGSVGKKCKCPKCNTINVIPAAAAEIEDEEVAAPRQVKKAKQTVAAAEPLPRSKKKTRANEDDEDADDVFDAPLADEEDEEDIRPKKRKGKKGKTKKAGSNKGLIIGGAIGLGVLLLVVAGSVGGFAWWYFGSSNVEDVWYFPNNTQSINSRHVDQIRSSAAYQEMVAALGKEPDFDRYETQYGIDKTNLDRVATASSRAPGVETITVIRTKTPVKPAEVTDRIKQKDGTVIYMETPVGRYIMHEPKTAPGVLNLHMSFCVVNNKTIVYGQANVVRGVLERGKMPDLAPSMQAAMKEADFSRSETQVVDFSATALAPMGPMMGFGFGAGKNSRMPDRMIVEQAFGADVVVRIVLTFKDGAAANTAKNEFDDGFQKAKSDGPNKDLLAEIQVSSSVSGNTVTVNQTMPAKTFAKLVAGK